MFQKGYFNNENSNCTHVERMFTLIDLDVSSFKNLQIQWIPASFWRDEDGFWVGFEF